jgi:peptide/nickel transport system substrate-binding protein
MRTTRRSVLGGSLAGASLYGFGLGRRGARAQGQKLIRVVPHADLRVLDPIWTTAHVSAYHGALVYDTLFGIDENLVPQPQMVEAFEVSDDRLTYRFRLRQGLGWHDGTAVTAEDCVASIRRWAARDAAGQHMFLRVDDLVVDDERSFRLVLKEPYGLVIDALASTSTPVCFMMRKEDAATDPNEQITNTVGSGPFRFVADEWVPGSRVVYVRNDDYRPRDEPASGMAGGKVVHLDRVEWLAMPDPQTAVSALMAGEIDLYETPPADLLPVLEANPDVVLTILSPMGNMGVMRLNHLHPPFDDVRARRAMLKLLRQEDFLQVMVGNPGYYRVCASPFACGSLMANDAGSGWETESDVEGARALFEEAGYDGRPIVILQPTDIHLLSNAAQVTAQFLRQAGLNVELAASDWGGVVTRRAVKAPPEEGGWNIFVTWGDGNSHSSPIADVIHPATGANAWFGWPENALQEELRDQWSAAPTLEERQAIARRLQENFYDYVHHVPFGQWFQPVAHRARLTGLLRVPVVVPFWNVDVTG